MHERGDDRRLKRERARACARRLERAAANPAEPVAGSAILYEGPSELDGAPIVVVAVGLGAPSRNVKTGRMLQTYILRADVDPVRASRTGADASICGKCPHRGRADGEAARGRTCYVVLGHGPSTVYRTYLRGGYGYAEDISAVGAGRRVRIGTYGDPAAVPARVWAALTSRAAGWTGYTHQWRDRPDLARWCMASADSEQDRAAARERGFRTFRVSQAGGGPGRGEITCPAAKEAGKKTTCARCGLCAGASSKARVDVVIQVHGPGRTHFAAA